MRLMFETMSILVAMVCFETISNGRCETGQQNWFSSWATVSFPKPNTWSSPEQKKKQGAYVFARLMFLNFTLWRKGRARKVKTTQDKSRTFETPWDPHLQQFPKGRVSFWHSQPWAHRHNTWLRPPQRHHPSTYFLLQWTCTVIFTAHIVLVFFFYKWQTRRQKKRSEEKRRQGRAGQGEARQAQTRQD
jgi:hypothetical protein